MCNEHLQFLEWNFSEFQWTFPALTGILSLAYFIHNAVISITRNQRYPENNVSRKNFTTRIYVNFWNVFEKGSNLKLYEDYTYLNVDFCQFQMDAFRLKKQTELSCVQGEHKTVLLLFCDRGLTPMTLKLEDD